jgi:hypothetical protein
VFWKRFRARRSPPFHPVRPSVEVLEDRQLLSTLPSFQVMTGRIGKHRATPAAHPPVPGHALLPPSPGPSADPALSSALSFQFALDDPGRAFDAFPLLLPDLQAAGQILSGLLDGRGTLDVVVRPNNSIPRSSGGTVGVTRVGTSAGRSVYRSAALQEALTGVDPNGTGPEIELDFNTQTYLPHAWFDPSGTARTGTVPPDQTDFLSVALHELVHGLGFQGYRAVDGPTYGTLPADHESDFDAFTAFGSGADAGVLFFRGAHAASLYGGPVPLTSVGTSDPVTSENFYHVGNPIGGPGEELLPDLMNGIVFYYGTRYTVSPLDLAVLADLGWSMHGTLPYPPVPTLGPLVHHGRRSQQTVTLTNVGGVPVAGPFLLALDGLSPRVQLVNRTGFTGTGRPRVPYLKVAADLAPGAALTVTLRFHSPAGKRPSYQLRVVTGPVPGKQEGHPARDFQRPAAPV